MTAIADAIRNLLDISGTMGLDAMASNISSITKRGAVAGTISTKSEQYTIPAGYHNGNGTVGIDVAEQAKIIAENIKNGVTILGVLGTASGDTYAFIAVTYPAGLICTCSYGTTTLTARDTSGKALFSVPSAGTWTVQCYDGADYDSSNNKKSVTVEITSEGQSISITLNVLPEIYQEVEYIQTTGTQYIDTGIKPINRTYQVSTKIGVTTTEQDKCVFGTNGAAYYQLTPYANKWYYGTNGTEGNAGIYKATVGDEYIIEFNNSLYGIVINGDLIVSDLSFFNGNNSIKISSRNDNSRLGKFKYYYFRIINNQTKDILMDLIPCYRRSDSVAGMYDFVSGGFFINSGTGTFLVGGDIP